MNYLVIFNNFVTIISFLVGVPSIISLSIKLYRYSCDVRYAKKVLGFDKQPVQITQCIFEIENKGYGEKYYVTRSSVIALKNIISLLNAVGQKFNVTDNSGEEVNEIHIGGFVANKKVGHYLKAHFPEFKYITSGDKIELYRKNHVDPDILIRSDNQRTFKLGNKILDMTGRDIEYAFLIKLTKDDFKDSNTKTVHIIFGRGDAGTIKATEFLAKNYKNIYNAFKDKHYFFAIEVNNFDNSVNGSKGIIDFTDIMFPQ